MGKLGWKKLSIPAESWWKFGANEEQLNIELLWMKITVEISDYLIMMMKRLNMSILNIFSNINHIPILIILFFLFFSVLGPINYN